MTQRSLERRYDAQRDGSIIQLLLCVTYSHIQHLEHLHAALLVRASHLFNEFGDLPTNPMVVRHLPLLPHIAVAHPTDSNPGAKVGVLGAELVADRVECLLAFLVLKHHK